MKNDQKMTPKNVKKHHFFDTLESVDPRNFLGRLKKYPFSDGPKPEFTAKRLLKSKSAFQILKK